MKNSNREFKIGDTAYIVEHCQEPTTEQADADHFDLIWWQNDNTVEEVFETLVRAIAFARRAVKTSIFGNVRVFEAKLENPYRSDFPDWMVKRTALRWKQIEGGYECDIDR